MILKLLGLQQLLDELFDDEWLAAIGLIEVWRGIVPRRCVAGPSKG